MGKQKRVRKNRRKRDPQIDPELQLKHDHWVLARARQAKEEKNDHRSSNRDT